MQVQTNRNDQTWAINDETENSRQQNLWSFRDLRELHCWPFEYFSWVLQTADFWHRWTLYTQADLWVSHRFFGYSSLFQDLVRVGVETEGAKDAAPNWTHNFFRFVNTCRAQELTCVYQCCKSTKLKEGVTFWWILVGKSRAVCHFRRQERQPESTRAEDPEPWLELLWKKTDNHVVKTIISHPLNHHKWLV